MDAKASGDSGARPVSGGLDSRSLARSTDVPHRRQRPWRPMSSAGTLKGAPQSGWGNGSGHSWRAIGTP